MSQSTTQSRVARDVGHAVEVRGAELHAQQVLALGRAGRRLEVQRRHAGEGVVHHLEAASASAMRGSVSSVGRSGGGTGLARLPQPQRPIGGIESDELTRGGGARARKTEDHDRALDHLVVRSPGATRIVSSMRRRFTRAAFSLSPKICSPSSLSSPSARSASRQAVEALAERIAAEVARVPSRSWPGLRARPAQHQVARIK